MPPYHACSATHARIARECVSTVPSGSLSAGSFVSPVASRSSSREPLHKKRDRVPVSRDHLLVGDSGRTHRSCTRRHGWRRGPPSSPWHTNKIGGAVIQTPGSSELARLAVWACTTRRRTPLRTRSSPSSRGMVYCSGSHRPTARQTSRTRWLGLDALASSHRNVRVSTSARLRLPCSAAMSSLPIQIVEVCSPFWTIPGA